MGGGIATKDDVMTVMVECARRLEGAEQTQESALQDVVRLVAGRFRSGASLLLLAPDGHIVQAAADHPAPEIRAELRAFGAQTDELRGSLLLARVLAGEAILEAGEPEAIATLVTSRTRRRVLAFRVSSGLAVPLAGTDGVFGALVLFRVGEAPPFVAADRRFLAALATRLAPMIDRNRALGELLGAAPHLRAGLAPFEVSERFRAIFDHSPVGIARFVIENGEPGRMVEVNAAAGEILGVPADRLLGLPSGSFDHPDDPPVGREQISRMLRERLPSVRYQKRLIRADGETIHVDMHVSAVRRSDGSTPFGIVLLSDVTDQRRFEAELQRSEALMRGILDSALDGVLLIDAEGCVIDANPAAEAILGVPAQELQGRSAAAAVLGPDDAGVQAGLLSSPCAPTKLLVRHDDGTSLPVELTVTPVDGHAGLLAVNLRDVTEQDRAERRLKRQSERQSAIAAIAQASAAEVSKDLVGRLVADAIVDHLPARAVFIVRRDGGRLYPLGLRPVGGRWSADELPVDDLPHYGTRPVLLAADELPPGWPEAGVTAALVAEYPGIQEGTSVLLAALDPQPDEGEPIDAGLIDTLVGVLDTWSQRSRSKQELQHQALHDPLTGLPNRVLLGDRLEQVLTRATRQRQVCALLRLGVDRFDRINIAYGPQAGDELLRNLARRLADAVGPGDTVARLEGDEFAVLTENVEGERGTVQLAEDILSALDLPVTVHDRPVVARLSIGAALGGEVSSATADDLIRDAGAALAQAREDGGGRCKLFDPNMRRSVLRSAGLERDLRRALEQDELSLVYQPVADLVRQDVASIEALVRWDHPREGLLLPEQFMDVAHAAGLAGEIAVHVLRDVCRQVSRWSAHATVVPPVTVNISEHQLADPAFLARVEALLRQSGVPAGQLGLEVKEAALLDDRRRTRATLDGLAALGVGLVLDDFSAGWLGSGDLRRHPIAAVKLARALVDGLATGEQEQHVVRALGGLAGALGLTVVAKGCESEADARAAAGLGCTQLQGLFVARPGSPAAIEALLRYGLDSALLPAPARESDPAPVIAPVLAEGVNGEEDAGDEATMALSEAADALGVSASTLRRWADAGRLRVVRTAGGHRRFVAADVRRLSQEARGKAVPAVRSTPLPGDPVPELADLLLREGPALMDRVIARLYEPGREGWFSDASAGSSVDAWQAAVRNAAAGHGPWSAVETATRELARRGHYAGAAALECHIFVERACDAFALRLQERGAPASVLVIARRLQRTLHQMVVQMTESLAAEGRQVRGRG